jgi:hypothetical protein
MKQMTLNAPSFARAEAVIVMACIGAVTKRR